MTERHSDDRMLSFDDVMLEHGGIYKKNDFIFRLEAMNALELDPELKSQLEKEIEWASTLSGGAKIGIFTDKATGITYPLQIGDDIEM